MATTPVSYRPTNHTYLGNTNHDEVHSLLRETTNCQINEVISAGHAVIFTPDTLTQAHADGFDNCAYCIGDSNF